MVSRRFSLLRIFVAINLDKSNYVNDYKILMYMLISFRIRDYLNLPLHSQTAPIFYTYINVFEILVASATLIVNINLYIKTICEARESRYASII